ncbi:hypothetical protein V1511DRAFT_178959 [Dipodascopsis uninucleata]
MRKSVLNRSRQPVAGAMAGDLYKHAPVRPSPLATHDQNGMPLEIWNRLRSFPLFSEAPDGFLTAISKKLRPQFYSSQDFIATEGDEARAMYWLVRGAVGVTSRDGESVYAELTAGAFFGEIGILFNCPRTASVVARSRCMVVVLTAEALNEILPQYPEVEQAIRQEAQERLSLLQKQKKAPPPDIPIRDLLKEIPLFADTPMDILHTLALKIEPKRYSPFEYIITQDLPGRELYFILDGTVEVIDEVTQQVRARLSKGSHFGEVTFLSLSPTRTASVRSVTMVDCLVLTSSVLESVLDHYPRIRENIEQTARARIAASLQEQSPPSAMVTEHDLAKPLDPDPFTQPTDSLDSQLVSLATLATTSDALIQVSSNDTEMTLSSSSSSPSLSSSRSQSPTLSKFSRRGGDVDERASRSKRARRLLSFTLLNEDIPDNVLVTMFAMLPLHELVRLQRVCKHWFELIRHSPKLLKTLDLTPYNTLIYDNTIDSIASFVGSRPKLVNISNCFHLTDEGFTKLVTTIGRDIKVFKMKSVWEVSGMAIMELTVPFIARTLEEVDFSNCRKVGDATLARVVGWIVPGIVDDGKNGKSMSANGSSQRYVGPPAGSIIGCPNLKRIALSYCKHITDKSMYHIAMHASQRIECLNLTRCTTITDVGFSYWSTRVFPRLRQLCLADCTFLTDKAIVSLTSAAKSLEELDLSFCCALSDVSVEVLSLGCIALQSLNLAFCGSAVSDASLRAVARHLVGLRWLSVRGCVRVTNAGVEAVGTGCFALQFLDVSQCRNVNPLLPPMSDMKSLDAEQLDEEERNEHIKYGYGVGLWKNRIQVVY